MPKNKDIASMTSISEAIRQAAQDKRERVAAQNATPPGWQDKDDIFTKHIDAAHPIKTKEYWQYDLALMMVGNRNSKGSLVELVAWLIREQDILKQAISANRHVNVKQVKANQQTVDFQVISDALHS